MTVSSSRRGMYESSAIADPDSDDAPVRQRHLLFERFAAEDIVVPFCRTWARSKLVKEEADPLPNSRRMAQWRSSLIAPTVNM